MGKDIKKRYHQEKLPKFTKLKSVSSSFSETCGQSWMSDKIKSYRYYTSENSDGYIKKLSICKNDDI